MKNEKGFTLIELLIVLALTGIIVTVIVSNVISYYQSSNCKHRAIGWKVIDKNVVGESHDSSSNDSYGRREYHILLESPSKNRCSAIVRESEWLVYVVGDTYPRLIEEP